MLALAVELLAGAATGSALGVEADHWNTMNRGLFALAFDPRVADPAAARHAELLIGRLPRVPGVRDEQPAAAAQ